MLLFDHNGPMECLISIKESLRATERNRSIKIVL